MADVGRLAITAAGYYFFGPVGGIVGSMLGNAIFPPPTQKAQGPRLGDLKVTGVEYGQPITHVQGMMRVPAQVWWASDRREIAHTTTEDVGGKGGGQEVERTDFSYEVDILFGLTSNEIAGVTRVWLNGKLVWTNLDSDFAGQLFIDGGGGGALAAAVANALASLTASQNTTVWQRMTVYTGAADQLPDPTYEAAVGTANAVAYRGRGSVFIQGLQLGGSGVIPNLTFEVVTKASSATVDADSDVMVQCEFDSGSENDVSTYVCTDNGATMGAQVVSDGEGGYVLSVNHAGTALAYSGGDLDNNHEDEDFTEECYVKHSGGSAGAGGYRIMLLQGTSGDNRTALVMNSSSGDYLKIQQRDQSNLVTSDATVPIGVWTHIAVTYEQATGTIRVYIDGVKTIETTVAADPWPSANTVWTLGTGEIAGVGQVLIDDARLCVGRKYTGDSFTPPARDALPDPQGGESTELTPIAEDLADVVSALCERAGLLPAQIDVSDLQGSPQTTVRGMAVTQVTSTRAVLETLMQAYFFEAHCSDKIYFVLRGGSSVETIDFEDMGASESDGADTAETFQPIQANDIEFPAQFSLTYANYYDDYQNDTQESDRLISAVDRSVEAVQVPLALTPSEAKTIADKLLLDRYVSMTSSTARVLGEFANVEPTDIVTPTDGDGNTYRMRVAEVLDNYPLLELKLVLDNATVMTHTASASNDYQPSIVVEEPPDSLIELMDIPILRDADDDPGFYAAMKGSNAENWPGGALHQSSQVDYDYSEVRLFQDSAVFGTCSAALGDWESGRLFDMVNAVTVDVGEGALSSSTRAAVLADQEVNAMMIGDEIIQFITATLVATGVYTLSGLLRGCRGTEWATTGHEDSERCVLLRPAGLRRIAMQSNELGLTRYYIGVTIGQPQSAGLTGSPAGGEAFVNNGRGLRPFSPAYLRFNRATNGDITITGQRRSRLGVRMVGTLGINVPDDDTTSWLLDILSNEGSPQTTYRTLTGTVSGTGITWTYSLADQISDLGSPTLTQLAVGAYGYSSTVGRSVGKFKTGAV